MQHILSLSYGKDSLACLGAIEQFATEAGKDELWFDIVSAWLKDYIKVDFYQDDWMEVPRNGQCIK